MCSCLLFVTMVVFMCAFAFALVVRSYLFVRLVFVFVFVFVVMIACGLRGLFSCSYLC